MSTLQQEEAGTWDHSVTRVLDSSWHMAVHTQWCTDRRSSHCPQRGSRLWSGGGRRMVGWAEHRPQRRRFSVPGKAARGGLGTLQRLGVPWASPQHDEEETRRRLVRSWLHSEYNFGCILCHHYIIRVSYIWIVLELTSKNCLWHTVWLYICVYIKYIHSISS